jgi:hypothetical protein
MASQLLQQSCGQEALPIFMLSCMRCCISFVDLLLTILFNTAPLYTVLVNSHGSYPMLKLTPQS